jgi:antitoxin FitA
MRRVRTAAEDGHLQRSELCEIGASRSGSHPRVSEPSATDIVLCISVPATAIANPLVLTHSAGNDSKDVKAFMSQLTVRNVSAEIVRSLKQRAAAHGRSAEAEHREILREALREGADDFQARAKTLRERLRSTIDMSEIIRADRDRDGAA